MLDEVASFNTLYTLPKTVFLSINNFFPWFYLSSWIYHNLAQFNPRIDHFYSLGTYVTNHQQVFFQSETGFSDQVKRAE